MIDGDGDALEPVPKPLFCLPGAPGPRPRPIVPLRAGPPLKGARERALVMDETEPVGDGGRPIVEARLPFISGCCLPKSVGGDDDGDDVAWVFQAGLEGREGKPDGARVELRIGGLRVAAWEYFEATEVEVPDLDTGVLELFMVAVGESQAENGMNGTCASNWA